MLESIRNAGEVCVLLAMVTLIVCGTVRGDLAEDIKGFDIDQATLDLVQAQFGVPLKGSWGHRSVSVAEGPNTQDYLLYYANRFVIRMNYSWVLELRIQSATLGYVWQDSVRIGSSIDDVFSAAGAPDVFVEGQPNGGLGRVFFKDIHGRQGDGYYHCPDMNVRFYFSNDRVSAIHLTRSNYDSFFGHAALEEVVPYQDVRWLDMSSVPELTETSLRTLTFNSSVTWDPGNAPKAQSILAAAKTPGLGVSRLHRQGVTGEGVTVGMIGEALWLDHEEYDGKVVEYHNPLYVRPHNHRGAGQLSLMVGRTIGTAPAAKVYYAACRDGVHEVDYVKALYWMIRKNETLSEARKIRVVAVAAAPGEDGVVQPTTAYLNWPKACAAAEEAGILVLDATQSRRHFDACWYDLAEPDRLEYCTPGFPDVEGRYNSDTLMVPTSQRTVAEQYEFGVSTYQYVSRHGIGWTTPYAAGVLAMGWQAAPDMSGPEMLETLWASAYHHEAFVQIIHPQRFIHSLGAESRTFYVDQSAPGALNGSSWQDAFHDLQEALAQTVYGDTIKVAEGYYHPDSQTGNRQTTFFLQKGVSLIGGYPAGGGAQDIEAYETVLTGDFLGNDETENFETMLDNSLHVVTGSYTDEHTVLEGVTVTAGYTEDQTGAGLFARYGDLTIQACRFEANHAYQGGAMELLLSQPSICSSRFVGNSSQDLGGAVLNDQLSTPHFAHCIFAGNRSGTCGGAMANCDYGSDPILIHCTVTNNTAQEKAGGIYSWSGDPVLSHCIVWNNRDAQGRDESSQLQHDAGARPLINYSCIEAWSGFWKGQGNFSQDPLFADPQAHDYHLKSASGRWDEQTGQWLKDTETSPCIDAGDPSLECTAEPVPHGQRLNVGAYGGTTCASRS